MTIQATKFLPLPAPANTVIQLLIKYHDGEQYLSNPAFTEDFPWDYYNSQDMTICWTPAEMMVETDEDEDFDQDENLLDDGA